MNMTFTKSIHILPSQVNPEGRLGVANTFDLFMDTATEAATEMGVGWDFLKKRGLFWITVKTRIQFLNPPAVLDTVEVSTWPEAPDEKRCNRHYRISRNGETLVVGKTEWAIVNVLTHRPQRMDRLLPQGLVYPDERACPEPFPRIDESFPDAPYARHRVVATDIDMARHMNNVAYVRAIINGFSRKEWKRMGVTGMDVIFRASAHEGDVLQFRKRESRGFTDICGSLDDGSIIVLARLTR